jgi:hypothetical protein
MPSHAIPQRRTVQAHPPMREAIKGNHRRSYRPSTSEPPMLYTPLAFASTRSLVHAARSRLYVGVLIWSVGTFISLAACRLRQSW